MPRTCSLVAASTASVNMTTAAALDNLTGEAVVDIDLADNKHHEQVVSTALVAGDITLEQVTGTETDVDIVRVGFAANTVDVEGPRIIGVDITISIETAFEPLLRATSLDFLILVNRKFNLS